MTIAIARNVMTTDNRTNEPTEEQIERALDAISRFNQWTDNPRGAMRAALTAAGVASQEVIDDAADEQDDLRLHMLAPQEPSQNETKSGNNFVSLDPEKVAEVIGAAQVIREVGEDGRTSISFASGETIARALCEAYTEGKLTK